MTKDELAVAVEALANRLMADIESYEGDKGHFIIFSALALVGANIVSRYPSQSTREAAKASFERCVARYCNILMGRLDA
jgi:hypothetical protein